MGSGYYALRRSTTDCVHFVYVDQIEDFKYPIAKSLEAAGIKYAYVDYQHCVAYGVQIANAVAQRLELPHQPYEEGSSQPSLWVPFLDDLMCLADRDDISGVAIIIDNADAFLSQNSRAMFALTQTFLLQVHHWLKKQKPCHLCFQMERCTWVMQEFSLPDKSKG